MKAVPQDAEGKEGEVCRFGDLGWGVESLAFSPDGALLAAGKLDRAVMVFDIDRKARSAFYDKLEGLGQVTCVTFAPDGAKLLSGGWSGRIQIWDVGTGGTLAEGKRFVGHSGAIRTIALSGDGKLVLSGGDEKKARAWELGSGRELFAIDGFNGAIKATFITKSGKQGLASDGETLALIDMKEGKAIQKMKLKSYAAQAVAISPDGTRVVVQDLYTLLMWDVRNGQQYPPFQDHEIQWSARFLPNGKYLLSGGRGKVNLWEVETQRKVYEFDTATAMYVKALAASPDGRHFAAIPNAAGQAIQVFRLPADLSR